MAKGLSGLRLVLAVVFSLVFVLAVLFVPAGSLDWVEGWLFVAVLFAYVLLAGGWLKKNSPVLVEKRVSFKAPVKGWDKIIMLFLGIFVVALFAVAGLDAVRFRLTEMPLALKAIGFAGFGFGLYLNFLAMKENAFASRIVELQEKQKAVETGPYATIRHPMYAAFILLFASWPLALGSLYAFVPAAISATLLVERTRLEDKTLQKGLAGYKEYAKKVRWKIMPHVW